MRRVLSGPEHLTKDPNKQKKSTLKTFKDTQWCLDQSYFEWKQIDKGLMPQLPPASQSAMLMSVHWGVDSLRAELNCCSEVTPDKTETWNIWRQHLNASAWRTELPGLQTTLEAFWEICGVIFSPFFLFFLLHFLDVEYSVKGICGLVGYIWDCRQGSIWRTEVFAMIRHAHCHGHGTEERLRPEPVVDLANLWRENSIDYTLKVHVYIENLTFFSWI